jgi:uncharacterized LabA/DUF88 family protein
MHKVSFLIDGFNVYHSLEEASKVLAGQSIKWLDLHSLCKSYIPAIHKSASLQSIHYFSALANHYFQRNPGKVKRHKRYIRALKTTGINVHLGKFKKKYCWCSKCKSSICQHEEKGTDVAIGVKLIELFHSNECDYCVLVTGDTDLIPAIECARRLFPQKKIVIISPYKRENGELKKAADKQYRIKPRNYRSHQFPPTINVPGSSPIIQPSEYV